MTFDRATHVVAVVGGACAGSTVAEILAESGAQVVVFDQNPRPYGKIEDGLPRWHQAQRRMEYEKIDARLSRPGVHFVPLTRLGSDVDFEDLASRWGFSAVVLANGAWSDRVLDVPGASDVVDKGLVYQNPFVYWFNHKNEASYQGPRYEVQDGAVVVGGGLASIDVVKILQLELYQKALAARGVEVTINELEHDGIPKTCAAHEIDPTDLGIQGALLCYRRRVEDMPLASLPKSASEKQKAKIGMVRAKILTKAMDKYRFRMQTLSLPKEVLIEDGRLAGIVLQGTRIEGRGVVPVDGEESTIRTGLVISSIGSIPEPIKGIVMDGAYYKFKDWDTGEYAPVPGVFATGNVITGQGNIKASLDHGRAVGKNLVERYLGVADDDEPADLAPGTGQAESRGAAAAEALVERLERKAPLPAAQASALLERVAERQREVGYTEYRAWLERVTPPDME